MEGPFPALATPRLRLTALSAEDLDDFFALLHDPEVTRFMGMAPLGARAEAEELLACFAARAAAGAEVRWAIRRGDEARLIGVCTLEGPFEPRRRAEIGYVVARAHWRQGVASEAVRAVLGYAFGPLQLNRVEALVYAEHTASRALLAKLGFVQEGYLRQHAWENGRYWDDVIYALLAQEYSVPVQAAPAMPPGAGARRETPSA